MGKMKYKGEGQGTRSRVKAVDKSEGSQAELERGEENGKVKARRRAKEEGEVRKVKEERSAKRRVNNKGEGKARERATTRRRKAQWERTREKKRGKG